MSVPTPEWSIVERPAGLPQRDQLGEAPFWDAAAGVLYWVDIVNKRVHQLRPETGEVRVWTVTRHVSSVIPSVRGDLILAMTDGLYRMDLASGSTTLFCRPDPDTGNRSNECGTDPQGRILYGSMDNNIGPNGEAWPVSRASGKFYSVDETGRAVELLDGISITNIVAFTPAGDRWITTDTPHDTIWSYAWDPEGPKVSDRQIHVLTGPPHPDGGCVDADGYLWSCRWGSSCVVRYRPDGAVDRTVQMPVEQPSSCGFGGEDLRTLYITSARQELEGLAPDSLDGALFSLRVETPGLPRQRFRG